MPKHVRLHVKFCYPWRIKLKGFYNFSFMSYAHWGTGGIILNLMLFHFLNQVVDFKPCLATQNKDKNNHFYTVHCYYRDGPSWQNFCKWIWRHWQTWWAKQWATVRHLSLPQKPQREVSMPEVTDGQYWIQQKSV